ncbi:hypothetical protein [Nonomuraea sp. NEAU-A123]|nr:hypothetical protein [Nonomuraea sp. NEAU-A123]MBT2225112.1 hypothetical protein [Nonomuraea sp. NEAU-A123]
MRTPVEEAPRPNRDRHQRLRTGLTVIKLVLWLGWLIWTSSDHDATH